MTTFEIELDPAQVALLESYAEGIGLTAAESVKLSVLWLIRVETMVVTDTRPTYEDVQAGLDAGVAHLDQIVETIKAARDVPEGNPFDTPEQ